MMNYKKGFTLIELLIVIAIIGILAGAVVVTLQGNTTDAEKKVANLNVVQVARAVAISESTEEGGSEIGEFACPTGVEPYQHGDGDTFPALETGKTYCRYDNEDKNGVDDDTPSSSGAAGDEDDNGIGWIVFELHSSTKAFCQDNTTGGAKEYDVNTTANIARIGGEDCDNLNKT